MRKDTFLLVLLLPAAILSAQAPTVAEAHAFIVKAEKQLFDLGNKAQRASWVQENFITNDTQGISADAQQEVLAATTDLALQAARFNGLTLPPADARKFLLLKLSLVLPAPKNPEAQAKLTKISVALDSEYGKGKYCPDGPKGKCLSLNDLERIMTNSRDPKEILMAWKGWHSISPPMRQRYAEMVDLANVGARDLGFKDTGAMWRSKYDLPPDAFAAEMDRLWDQVRPLYEALHTHVRAKLIEKYGKDVVGSGPLIPAHLLGNMWAQEWGNIYDLVAPPGSGPGYDLTALLRAKSLDPQGMVHYGERFFMSLGFPPLPNTFWERSLFTKPADRDVVCHASAWDVDSDQDLRVKMCIEVTGEFFTTIHHELGHNFYQRAYSKQDPFFRDSANDGFHEAIGDTIALSVTPEYLKEIGLLDKVPGPEGDLGLLMHKALDKIAFLPFGLMVDQWRWKVFAGQIKPADYNKAWWELRAKYQGLMPPVPRSEDDFDPGAKYHVAASVPYARYFLADILQFQFHRALCKEAGYSGPLHRCSIYNNKAAGAKLAKMLEMGESRPWPDALEAITGQKQMDATAIVDYFAPLKKWLDEQNAARAKR